LDGVCQGGSDVACPAGAYCEATRGCVRDPTHLSCPGDCNDDGAVTIDELMKGTSIQLDRLPLQACFAFDRDFDERLSIDELVSAVRAALEGC
jgi:hypothetical protein